MFARATRSHIRELIVGGRTVVKKGTVLGVDLDAVQTELRARYRAAMPERAGLKLGLPKFEAAIGAHYRRLGCC